MKVKNFILFFLLTLTIGVQAQVEVISSGSGSPYILDFPAVFPLRAGVQITFKANVLNPTPTTINVTSTGVRTIKKEGGTIDLVSGDIKAGQVVTIVYDGVNWQMLTPTGNSPTLGSVTGTGTQNYITKWNTPGGTTIGNSSLYDSGTGIGIFNNTPAGDLHIFKNNGPRFILDADGANVNGTSMLDFTTGGNSSATSFVGTVSGWQFRSFTSGYSTAARQNDLQLRFYNGSAFTNAMYFDNTGNIGIDMLNPTSKLYIVGSGATNSSSSLRITNNSSSDMFYVNDAGEVGIRTAAPTANLHVVGTARITSLVGPGTVVADAAGNLSVNAAPSNAWILGGNGVTSIQNFGTTTNFDLPFITNGTERMRLNSAGTQLYPSTDNTLSLGSISNSWNSIYSDGYLYIEGLRWTSLSTNNTLIGTKGNQSFTSGVYNLGVGQSSGNAITTGVRNTLVGHRSGEGLSTANDNTLVGHLAGGLTNNLGNDNTLIGSYAGYGNANAGVANTYVGAYSGGNNTTGNSNAFLGYNSGSNNTTGYFNTFIGASAGQVNTIGNLNTFTGYLSGNSNTADNNTFYGYGSGRGTTTGGYNVFSGTAAGWTNTTGIGNSYYGGTSGYNANGSYNTYMGYSTGYTSTTGDYNTLIGSSSGASVANLGTFNTYLGYNTSGAASITNATAIGKSAFVSTSNSLVLGGTGPDAVNVGIGTDAPSTQLHVEGNARITGLGGAGGTVVSDASGYLSVVPGAAVSGSGINDYVARWTPSGSQLGTGVLIDDGNQVGIGANPMAKFMVLGNSNSPTLPSISQAAASLGTHRYSFSSGDVFDIGFQTAPQYAAWMQSGYSGNVEAILLNPLGGNVGVGTNAPTANLHVQGTARIGALVGPGTVVADANGNLSIAAGSTVTGAGTANFIARWTPSGTQLGTGLIYDNNTVVGIGTGATPSSSRLNIHATSGSGNLRLTSAATGQTSNDGFSFSNDGSNIMNMMQHENADWNFVTSSGSNAITIKPTTNIGLGTTSPSGKLHLYQPSGSTRFEIESDGAGGADAPIIEMDANGTNVGQIAIEFRENGAFMASTGWSTLAAQKYWFVYDGATSQNMVYKAGKLGIGTSVPTELVHMVSTDADIDAETYSTTESSSLHVKRARGTFGAPATVANGDYYGGIGFKGYAGGSFLDGAVIEGVVDGIPSSTSMPGRLEFMTTPAGTTTAVTRMTIKNDGRVGIGTTTPSYPFHVSGSNTSYFSYMDNNSTTGGYALRASMDFNPASGTGDRYGVYANAWYGQSNNYGVYAYGYGGTNAYGIYATVGGATTNYAGYFSGNTHIAGTLSKTGGAFKIDDPRDPENKYLMHSFVESPDMMNVYNGNINTGTDGLATVELPDYFSVINKDFRYQLTVIGDFAQAIVFKEIVGNKFIVKTDKPNIKVSWQVTGIRKDPWAEQNRIPNEIEKPSSEKGTYLNPEVYGQPKSKGLGYNQENDPEKKK